MPAFVDAHPPAQLTVRGWLFVVLSSMGLLMLAGAVAGALLLDRIDDVSHAVNDELAPARLAAFELQAALRDQETGVRGYAITADRRFLTPYYVGQHAEHAAAEDIRRLLGRRVDLIDDLDAIETAAADWRASSAEPLIAGVTPNVPDVVNGRIADRGKFEFDHLRALFETQNTDLAAASARAADELDDTRAWLDRVLGAVVLVFFGLAITLGLLARRAITLPLAAPAAADQACVTDSSGHTMPR